MRTTQQTPVIDRTSARTYFRVLSELHYIRKALFGIHGYAGRDGYLTVRLNEAGEAMRGIRKVLLAQLDPEDAARYEDRLREEAKLWEKK